MALSEWRHARSPWKAYFVYFLMGTLRVFWLFDFYDLSRSQFKRYNHFQGAKLKLISLSFCFCIVCFCTCIGFFKILHTGKDFFLENRGNNLFQKFSSSLFQYSERSIASTLTNDTSAERSFIWHPESGCGIALSGRRHARSPWKAYFVYFVTVAPRVFRLLDFHDLSRSQF